jgi:hypothetical protein
VASPLVLAVDAVLEVEAREAHCLLEAAVAMLVSMDISSPPSQQPARPWTLMNPSLLQTDVVSCAILTLHAMHPKEASPMRSPPCVRARLIHPKASLDATVTLDQHVASWPGFPRTLQLPRPLHPLCQPRQPRPGGGVDCARKLPLLLCSAIDRTLQRRAPPSCDSLRPESLGQCLKAVPV